jgi:hypothetical protein
LSDKFNVLQAAIVASHRIFVLLDLPVQITRPNSRKKPGKPSANRISETSGSLIKTKIGF